MKTSLKLLAILAICATAGTAGAQTLVSEYFDYSQASGTAINTLNGGSGWTTAWADQVSPGDGAVLGGSNLTFTNANYGTPTVTNANDARSSDAAAGINRSFSAGVTTEVWISFLGAANSGVNNAVILRPNSTTLNTSGIGIQSSGFYSRFASTTVTLTGAPTFVANTTYLFLMKLETNVSDSNDRASFWIFDAASSIDPTTINTTPMGSSTSAASVWTGVTGIGLNLNRAAGTTDSFADNFRIAYGGTTQENINAVLAVPEPSAWALLAAAGTFFVITRRRKTNG